MRPPCPVAGTSQWTAFEGVDAWILKLNADGSVAWQKTYGGDGDDFAQSIRQTSDGGYIVAGSRAIAELEDQDIWLLKLNPDGSVAWQRSYAGDRDDCANCVQQTVDGGYIVAGNSVIYSHDSVNDAVWVLKLNSDGTIAWQKTYDLGGWPEVAFSVQQTSDNGYVVAGYASPVVDGVAFELWVLKLNLDGSVVWQKTYGGAEDERAYSIQQTSDGGYIVAGWIESVGPGRLDFWIIKLNSDGSVAWEKTYGDAGDDRAFFIQQTSDGGYIVAGKTDSFSDPYDNVLVLKLDARGEIPGCSLMGTSNATTSDTSAVVKNTDVIPTMPSIVSGDTAAFPQGTSAETSYVCLYTGCTCDVNGDEEITPQDALCAFQKYLAICPTGCGPCEEVCCDVSMDGDCTPADALEIFKAYLGLPSVCN